MGGKDIGDLSMDVVEGGLARCALFASLPPEDIREVEGRCTWQRFASGEQVFDKESDTLDVYFVVEGALRILTGVGDAEVALADVMAGNYFGELAAIDGMKRSARVVATRDSLLASLDGPSFLDLMHRFPGLAVHVLERLTRIVRNLDARVTQLSTQSDSQRVMSELVRLAEPDASRPDGWYIADLPNHKEIASWAGTSREAVAQVIGELARDGVVRRKSMGLVITDWNRLRLMARAAAA
jgi:CRP/FNR family cyclic AMP-dependent transcriptional regulator